MSCVPIVQIVHYSDIHVRTDAAIRHRRLLQRVSRRLPRAGDQGLAGADSRALAAFERFLGGALRRDNAWRDAPVWLVDTGDGTTFGDHHSLWVWLNDWTPRFVAAAGPPVSHLCLYGNHDAWPGTHPLLDPVGMTTQRDNLRLNWFNTVWPSAPLAAGIPGGQGGLVELYALNSVDHGLAAGVRASGWVAPDRHWENPPPMVGPSAADDVARLAAPTANGAKNMRIIAMHYPVADAAGGSRLSLSGLTTLLSNRQQFASDLNSARHVTPPIGRMLLAGHTHVPHPPLGQLPPSLDGVTDPPLGAGSSQWVTASLSQRILAGAVPPAGNDHSENMLYDFPHQATVLRLQCEPTQPDVIVIERAIAGRAEGGEFDYLETTPGTGDRWERTTLTL